MVRYFPSNGQTVLPLHLGFLPDNPASPGELIITQAFSARLPVVCRQVHSKQPFGMFRGENAMNYAFSSFLLEAVLVIFFIKATCFILRPLRQPRIVCEIIGGMVVGPSMLGGSRTFSYYLFPPISNYIFTNLGLLGFFYFFFITAAKTDVAAIAKSPKKHKYIAAISVLVPMVCVGATGMAMRGQMDKNMGRPSSVGGIAFALAFSSFPVIYTILRDMNLLNSEVGKFAMSVALLGDMGAILVLVSFEAAIQANVAGAKAAAYYVVSVAIFSAFMILVVKRAFEWVVDQTPQGQHVDQNYIVIILMGVLVSCFLTDMLGLLIGTGPMWYGLIIPHGPPLGSTLAIRSETFIHEFSMPFAFGLVGLYTDVHFLSADAWDHQLAPLVYMTTVSFITKFISVFAAAFFFKVPTRDSLTLGLIMNLRGQLDIMLYLLCLRKHVIGVPGFTLLVLHTIVVTAISTPLISFLYDPNRPYRISKHRTIQHTPPSTEMGLVLAVSGHEALSGLITFLDFAYPTTSSPFSVYAIQLVELMGRATPVLMDHKIQKEEEDKEEEEVEEGRVDQVQSAFKLYQKKRDECVKLHAYTAHAPKRLMYQDICELALAKKTAFILLPYQQKRLQDSAPTELLDSGMLSVNADVLAYTPCSVCIYYGKGRLRNAKVRSSVDQQQSIQPSRVRQHTYRFVVLFLGGADNREALHLADRMTANPDITLTIVRFLSFNHEGEDAREKKLDDGVVTWFWVKNEGNDRVSYKEVVVNNGAETLAAIQAMNINDYDLWITGRREGINTKILEGLDAWSGDHQLGVIGETVAGSIFASEGSVLVVQQQVRNQKGGDGFLNGKFDYKKLVSPWSCN
ncbi:Cation/H(+) antiporter 24 [Raphanus sativus]|uniref:Cation/H(+) antiporter 24-like n=1 Tax=Raphanus sativus TaxID=3726 RepID=A0A9W3D4B1_RAPSA|nr:cation/H(+) antiporter 24-like [Raphanus sativus]KAJ4911094.1 Cation/H(+) antiporter 24 [Raphanus sativus]